MDFSYELMICPKCGSANLTDLTDGKDDPWWFCEDCTHSFMTDEAWYTDTPPVAPPPPDPLALLMREWYGENE